MRERETSMILLTGGLYVGLSGWSYPEWRSDFYKGIPQRRWLSHCAKHFSGIEVNGTFYRMLAQSTLARWYDETPADFAFAVKAHRFITHVRRLNDVAEPVARQKENAAPLHEKLRVVLWQMPGSLNADVDRLSAFARLLSAWPEARHALEFRNKSWFTDAVADILSEHRLAACMSDAAKWPLWDRVTTDLVYVRLHGHERTYSSEYGRSGLAPWAERIQTWLAEGREVHVYFDNDIGGAAPRDAQRLIALLGESGKRGARSNGPAPTA